jgi:hypothetical protein
LIAAGPDFREHATSRLPTGNVDLAPTLLRLLGIARPASMTGRVIEEGLRNGSTVATRVGSQTTVRSADGTYTLVAHFSSVGSHRYLDDTEVRR